MPTVVGMEWVIVGGVEESGLGPGVVGTECAIVGVGEVVETGTAGSGEEESVWIVRVDHRSYRVGVG